MRGATGGIRSVRGGAGLAALLASCAVLAAWSAEPASAGGGKVFQFTGADGCTTVSGLEGCATNRNLSGAAGLAISPDGNHLYAVSEEASSLTVFLRSRRKGRIVQLQGLTGCISQSGNRKCATARGMLSPFSVAVSPDGRNVYVATADGLAIFARNRNNGRLEQLGGSRGCVTQSASDGCAPGRGMASGTTVAVSPDGKHVYLTGFHSDAISVFSRDPATGEVSQLPGAQGCISAAGTEGCATGRALARPYGLTVSPAGQHVFASSFGSDSIAVLPRDATSGALTQLPGADGCVALGGAQGCGTMRGVEGPNGLAVSPDGRSLYVAASGSGSIGAFSIGPSGALVQLAGKRGCMSFRGADGCGLVASLFSAVAVAVSSDGRNVYVASKRAITTFRRRAKGAGIGRLSPIDCISQGGVNGCASGRALDGVSSVVIDPTGHHAYTTAETSSGIAAFARDPQQSRVRIAVSGAPRKCAKRTFKLKVRVASRLPLRQVKIFRNGELEAKTSQTRFALKVPAPRGKGVKHRLHIVAKDVSGARGGRRIAYRGCG